VHGNQTERVPDAYKRYLSNFYQSELKLFGTPVRIDFKGSDNPYKHIRNKLTPRQQRKRKRMLRHVKK
jgi:GTP-binding protein